MCTVHVDLGDDILMAVEISGVVFPTVTQLQRPQFTPVSLYTYNFSSVYNNMLQDTCSVMAAATIF